MKFEVSDGIMVARGDLGVECGFANVAAYQKKLLKLHLTKANLSLLPLKC